VNTLIADIDQCCERLADVDRKGGDFVEVKAALCREHRLELRDAEPIDSRGLFSRIESKLAAVAAPALEEEDSKEVPLHCDAEKDDSDSDFEVLGFCDEQVVASAAGYGPPRASAGLDEGCFSEGSARETAWKPSSDPSFDAFACASDTGAVGWGRPAEAYRYESPHTPAYMGTVPFTDDMMGASEPSMRGASTARKLASHAPPAFSAPESERARSEPKLKGTDATYQGECEDYSGLTEAELLDKILLASIRDW
jgi:hypothetical protein